MELGHTDRLILVYEGKPTGGQFQTIYNALAQARNGANAFGQHTPVIIAALGTRFKMCHNDGTPSKSFPGDKDGLADLNHEMDWEPMINKPKKVETCQCTPSVSR